MQRATAHRPNSPGCNETSGLHIHQRTGRFNQILCYVKQNVGTRERRTAMYSTLQHLHASVTYSNIYVLWEQSAAKRSVGPAKKVRPIKHGSHIPITDLY